MAHRSAKAIRAEWRRDARFLAKAEPFSPEATILMAGMQRLKLEYDRVLEATDDDEGPTAPLPRDQEN